MVSALLFTGVYWILLSLHCPFGSPLYFGRTCKMKGFFVGIPLG